MGTLGRGCTSFFGLGLDLVLDKKKKRQCSRGISRDPELVPGVPSFSGDPALTSDKSKIESAGHS